MNEDQRDTTLELDGVVPEIAMNEQLPEGVRKSGTDLDREHVETERQRIERERERERARQLDPELLDRRDALLEEMDKRIAAEIGVEDLYAELRDIDRQLAEDTNPAGDDE
jgi:hypothetical protein